MINNKNNIFVNKSYWKNMSEEELNVFANEIFAYYREHGFPYYSKDKNFRDVEFNKLMNYDFINLFDGLTIKQTMHGLALAWSYFPHSFNVKCNNLMTPYEAFINDDVFIKVIHKRLKIGTYMSDSGIRKMLKIYTGVQGVSNFRPTAAACIYNRYAPNGIVWDMSGGWGGRLLGAIVSKVNTYIATEPSTKTYNGLIELSNDYGKSINSKIYCVGSEDFIPDKNSLDLCFTSPPYFDTEKYSDENTQSYIKYSEFNNWVDGYLRKTIMNCYHGLKNNKYLLINIADDNKNSRNLENTTIEIAKDCGFYYCGNISLALSNINLQNKMNSFKFEPIFIFKK